MDQAARLAGFVTAHAVWSVSDGGPLIPLACAESAAGERTLNRFAAARLEDGAAQAAAWLDRDDAPRGVAVVDGYLTLPGGRTDALFVSIRRRERGATSKLELAVPYRPSDHPRGFAVHRPKILSFDGEPAALATFGEAFFAGVDSHERGGQVWNDHLEDDAPPPEGAAPAPPAAPPQASATPAVGPGEVPQRVLVAVVGVGLAAAMLLTDAPDDRLLRLLWGAPGALLGLAVAAIAILPLLRR